MEWILWVVPGGAVGVYLVVCIVDAMSYATRMSRQRQRANGLKLLRPRASGWVETAPVRAFPVRVIDQVIHAADGWIDDDRRAAS